MKWRCDLDAAGAAVAAMALVALFLRSIYHFDDTWDTTSYHLVFAAFRSGVLTPDDFVPVPLIAGIYKGYPPLLDVIRGYTWRITGSILVLQLFNLAGIVLLSGFWKLRFGLPMRWTLIAILSVPTIQTGTATLYIDTLANCCFAIPVSAFSAALIDRRPLSAGDSAVSFVALAVAANTKLQFVVVGAILFVALCTYQIYCLARVRQKGREVWIFMGLAAIACVVIFFTAWRNVLVEGNPLYPVAVTILGRPLPGIFPPGVWKGPEYLDTLPQPLKWLLSVLEFRAFEGRDLPYTVDQHGTIPVGLIPAVDPRPPSFRMGGYFVPLVLGLFTSLTILTKDYGWRDRLRWFGPLILTTMIVAPFPGSYDLRYFSFWMLNLIFLCFLAAQRVPASRLAFRSFVLAMFLSVGMLTGWRYFDFSPYSVQDHIKAHGFDKTITGHDLCFENRNRDSILFTHIFYSRGKYRVVDLAPGEHCP